MSRPLAIPFLLCCLLAVPLAAAAKLCGDNVNGRDVPCSCGDVVVSDLVLSDDPVASTTCVRDGLVIRAVSAPGPVTIDLRGKVLRGGKQGAGLKVLYGGPGGARIVSTGGPAAIEGFEDGIFAHGANSVSLIDGVIIVGSRRDGIRVVGSGYEIRNAETHSVGRDGFWLGGSGFRLSSTRSVLSKRSGYFVMGRRGTLGEPGAGMVAEGSGLFGFNLMGMGHRVQDCVARSGRKDGLMVMGMHMEIKGCTAADNGGHGIGGMGMDVLLTGNRALGNEKNGIYVTGPDTRDGGGNSGSDNRGVGVPGEPVDCEIHYLPCFL